MTSIIKKALSIILAACLLFVPLISASAQTIQQAEPASATEQSEENQLSAVKSEISELLAQVKPLFAGMAPLDSWDSLLSNVLKVLYNVLNIVVEKIVHSICAVYNDPRDWQNLSEYSAQKVSFLSGREKYLTEAAQGAAWSLGYASESIVPDDVDSGKYYIGRDLMKKPALGVYDDQRVRVSAVDDNSGGGIMILGSIDALGITSTDVRAIRKGVLEYCRAYGINVASINITATHCHSGLDVQGVSTEFFYKLFANSLNNKLGLFDELPGLEAATRFKSYFIKKSIEASIEAIKDMEKGSFYFATADSSEFVKDKRGLVSKEDLPEIASLRFVPASGSEDTYIADITCHPTSFSANHQYVGSDYIYYIDKYIKAQTNANFMLLQGAVGMISRDLNDVDETGMSEYETWSSETKFLGEAFGKLIINADYEEELAPILNVRHREIFVSPENSILVLACETKLVNNKVYKKENDDVIMPSEIGYIEFGHKKGFALFPGELYPEVFWGTEVTDFTNWDGTQWQYPSLHKTVKGVDVYAVSLANDALGYVLTDNNFAFMGHIIGEGTPDELLSVGKHMGSLLVGEYFEMIKDIKA